MRTLDTDRLPWGDAGLADALAAEVVALHADWMGLLYPRQHPRPDAVLGQWRPSTTVGWLEYLLWGLIGVAVVGALYPLGLLGTPIRAVERSLGRLPDRLGLAGVVWTLAVPAGLVSVASWLWLSRPVAWLLVAAAGLTVVAVGLVVTATQVGGRPTAVAVAYPLGLIALGLLPVTVATVVTGVPAAMVGAELAAVSSAVSTVPLVGVALATALSSAGSRPAVLAVLAVDAVVVGWLAGLLVVLTDLARPAHR